MDVILRRYTTDPETICGEAAALCTGSEEPYASLRGALASGHESIAEHAVFTFEIRGVSRVLLAQFTRHRLASFSVQSQRYCGVAHEWVVPDSVKERGWEQAFNMRMQENFAVYTLMVRDGVPEEDARYLIPQGVVCNLMVTMNVRELKHFFALRCCNRAQWEIRELADEMRRQCLGVAPMLFKKSGAACQQGKPCPEGRRTCGNPRGGVTRGKQATAQGASEAGKV